MNDERIVSISSQMCNVALGPTNEAKGTRTCSEVRIYFYAICTRLDIQLCGRFMPCLAGSDHG